MSFQFTVSPDLGTRQMTGWYVFNTWLQKTLDLKVHLELYRDFGQCRQAIRDDRVDLIFANPYDTSLLVRDKGFVPVAHPRARPDEVIIAVAADSAFNRIEDFKPGLRLASSSDPEVHMIGMIMLEAADLGPHNVTVASHESYVTIAKDLIRHQADAGFFMAESYKELSDLTRRSLRVVLQSELHVIHHMLLAGPRFAAHAGTLADKLVAMGDDAKGKALLADLGFVAWQRTDAEDAEFMVDVMETLT